MLERLLAVLGPVARVALPALVISCAPGDESPPIAEEVTAPAVATVAQKLASPVSRQNNTPCVYSGANGTGTELCFNGLGYSDRLPFTVLSVRPNNSRIWVTDEQGAGVPGATWYLVPDHGTLNLPANSGATRVWTGWQGANHAFVPGNIILESTNLPGAVPYCLDALGGNPYNGLQVGIYPCHPYSAAKWQITSMPLGGGSGYRISLVDFWSYCLDFSSPPANAGAKIQTWGCYSPTPPQQKWFRSNVSSGNGPQAELLFTRTAQGSDFYLDVMNGTIQAWQPVWGWPYNGGYAQRWVVWDTSRNHPPIIN